MKSLTPSQKDRLIRQFRAKSHAKIALRRNQKIGMLYVCDSTGMLPGETRHSKLVFMDSEKRASNYTIVYHSTMKVVAEQF